MAIATGATVDDRGAHAFRERAERMDAADPLGSSRAAFALPEGLIYLDGNSLGALTHAARERVARVVTVEWGRRLIGSWNEAGWVDLPGRVGARIARLVGAEAGSVVACDSTSVNLFKVLAAALDLNSERRIIVSERSNFPTDLYVAEGLAAFSGKGHALRLIDDPSGLDAALDGDVAVLMLTHVDYRTGRMHDMAAVTARAHAAGALMVWDLAHSAGAVPVDLAAGGADFAIGCGYKYLNGGPGAPAFLYVAPRHWSRARQPLSGWFGHAAPFSFEASYQPATGVSRFLTGTPQVLGMSALDAALDVWDGIDMGVVREKSVALCETFIAAVEALCAGEGLALAGPREAAARGSQVSFRHVQAYALAQALIERGVVGDFREPDILRFGFAPLYTRFVDAVDAAEILADILKSSFHAESRFSTRRAVT